MVDTAFHLMRRPSLLLAEMTGSVRFLSAALDEDTPWPLNSD